ncbi:unnamed protein product [Peniophora sp. CBMAI 1063]|nr:unnamed protein product [Peniophora sp. CBMAI 1063]
MLFHLITAGSIFAVLATETAAQALQIPSSWLNTSSSTSRSSREDIAYGAANTLYHQIGNTGQRTAQYRSNYYAVLALQDYYSGNTTWMAYVTPSMQSYYQQIGVYGNNLGWSGDANYWALAFYYAYRTYKQEVLLETAISIYNATYAAAFITPNDAAAGTGAGRNVSFALPSCTSDTFAGGVFVGNVSTDLDVCAECIGPFFTLSAYLFEATNQSYFSDAAQLSADFMIHHMWNGAFVVDTFRLHDCSLNPKPCTLDQAGFVEGLSVWANITQNATLTSLLRDVVSNVTTHPAWTSNNGVIDELNVQLSMFYQNFKGLLIRALLEARARNLGTDLDLYIEAYILNQFNSILSYTRGSEPDTVDFYGLSWIAQRATSFNSVGSIGALDVLNGVLNLTVSADGPNTGGATTSATTGVPTATDSARQSQHASIDTGAVAGGMVGGVIVLLAAIGLCLWRRRRRAAKREHHFATTHFGDIPTIGIDPFVLSAPANQPSSKWNDFYAPNSGGSRASSLEAAPLTSVVHRAQVAAERPMPGEDRLEQEGLDLPGAVGRLQNLIRLLHRQDEFPPALLHLRMITIITLWLSAGFCAPTVLLRTTVSVYMTDSLPVTGHKRYTK